MMIIAYLIFSLFLTIFLDKINLLNKFIGLIKTGNVLFFLFFWPLFFFIHFYLDVTSLLSVNFEKIGKKHDRN